MSRWVNIALKLDGWSEVDEIAIPVSRDIPSSLCRRREASDLARAMLLSTQEANSTQSTGPYLFSSGSKGTSGLSREMEMRPVVGGDAVTGPGDWTAGAMTIDQTVDPRDVMRPPDSSALVSEAGGVVGGGSDHTSTWDEIRSFTAEVSRGIRADCIAVPTEPSRIQSFSQTILTSAVQPVPPAPVPSSSSDRPIHPPTAAPVSSNTSQVPQRLRIGSAVQSSSGPARVSFTEKSASNSSLSKPLFSPTQVSRHTGAGTYTPRGAIDLPLIQQTRSDELRPGSAKVPLHIGSFSPPAPPKPNKAVAKSKSKSILSSDDEVDEQVELGNDPTKKSDTVVKAKSDGSVVPPKVPEGRGSTSRKSSMAAKAVLANLDWSERNTSPDPLRLGDESDLGEVIVASTSKAESSRRETGRKRELPAKTDPRGTSKDPETPTRSGRSERESTQDSHSNTGGSRRISSRAQLVQSRKAAEEEAAKLKRREKRAREKAELEEAERTGRDIREIRKENKRRRDMEGREAAKLRRQPSPDTEDDETDEEGMDDIETIGRVNEEAAGGGRRRGEKGEPVESDQVGPGGRNFAASKPPSGLRDEKAVGASSISMEPVTDAGSVEKRGGAARLLSVEIDESLNRSVKTAIGPASQSKPPPSTDGSAKKDTKSSSNAANGKSKAAKTAKKRKFVVEEEEEEEPAVVLTADSAKDDMEAQEPTRIAASSNVKPSAPPAGVSPAKTKPPISITTSNRDAEDDNQEEDQDQESAKKAKGVEDEALERDTPNRPPLKAIPARVNSVPRHSPGPTGPGGTPLRPGGIAFKTERADLASVLSKFPGSRFTGMSRRQKIVSLHQKIGPPKKELPPAPVKKEKRKKGDSDEEDEDEAGDDEDENDGGGRKKKAKGIEWFMVEEDGF